MPPRRNVPSLRSWLPSLVALLAAWADAPTTAGRPPEVPDAPPAPPSSPAADSLAIPVVLGGSAARFSIVVRTVRYREVHPSFEGGGCALTTDGEALCWGRNDAGTLGSETCQQRIWLGPRASYVCGSWPSAGSTFVRTRERFATLAVSWGHRCGLTDDGRALCWGALPEGDLVPVPCDTVTGGRCAYAPRDESPGARWRAVATGALCELGTTCALDADDVPYCWELAASSSGSTVGAPVPVPGQG